MAWFSQDEAKPVLTSPLTRERIENLFNEQEWHYSIDDDGDLGGRWGHTFFYFFVTGPNQDILNVSARFLIPIPVEKAEETRLFIEDWHRDRLWPKAYTLLDDEGDLRLAADVALDYEHGLSDAQLQRHVSCAIETTMQLTTSLMEALELEWNEED